MARATGWLWAINWIDVATLIGTPANDIGLFPRQSDMRAGFDWMRPSNDSDNVDDSSEITVGSSGFSAGYGGPNLQWSLRGMKPMMNAYIVTRFFPGGVFTYPATIAVPAVRSTGTTRYYQALADRSAYSAAQLLIGGLDMWKITFVDATEIFA